MTAVFLLSINLFVAVLFALAFAVVAKTHPTVRGAWWLAAGYGIGVLVVVQEFALPWLEQPVFAVVGIYLTYLMALSCGLVGLAQHYRRPVPKRALAIVWIASLAAIPVLLNLTYGSSARLLLYQLPYAALHLLMAHVVLSSGRRMALDRLLACVSVLVALACLSKPIIAWAVGSASSPQSYIASNYAAASQTIGSIALIALALGLLLVIMRDVMLEMVARSDTDPLSGALNRRGFEKHGVRAVERARRHGSPLAFVTLDLDRFKAVNDGFGHAAGDRIIRELADLLRKRTGRYDVVARMGGEEFAVLLPGRDTQEAYDFAEDIRAIVARDLRVRAADGMTVTASFGVAELQSDDQLSDLGRRSDLALYRAKAAGRNRVATLPPPRRPEKTGEQRPWLECA
ncbi:GGDEF domain-containing protein [Qipengyuania sp. JC766]|uniref:GGDEF domain-containing protein n=1 Tax=Qipengyuania sp. JC766 TaxID=3232139 RepID=UPI003458839C